LSKKQAQKCRRIISISESEKENLIHYFHVSPEKMVTIYHGVNTEVFHPRNRDIYRREIISKIGISQDDLLLLLVANRFKEKNLDILLEAFSCLNGINISLLVAGAGEKKLFEETVKKLNLQNKVFFSGCSKEMEKIYGAGDILILPSSYEAFGMVVLEAMAAGLPVIVSGFAGAAELITDRENGILLKDPTNPEEILEKLSLLVKNEQLRKSIGQAARRTAEKYDWKKNINQTLRLYQDVLENKSIIGYKNGKGSKSFYNNSL
jgi:UDP-glucose:(heptosyl)LPS alpha-1,3-glucosyltransferase